MGKFVYCRTHSCVNIVLLSVAELDTPVAVPHFLFFWLGGHDGFVAGTAHIRWIRLPKI